MYFSYRLVKQIIMTNLKVLFKLGIKSRCNLNVSHMSLNCLTSLDHAIGKIMARKPKYMLNTFQIPHLVILDKAEYYLKFLVSFCDHPFYSWEGNQDKTISVSCHFPHQLSESYSGNLFLNR